MFLSLWLLSVIVAMVTFMVAVITSMAVAMVIFMVVALPLPGALDMSWVCGCVAVRITASGNSGAVGHVCPDVLGHVHGQRDGRIACARNQDIAPGTGQRT
jgi:hypothetical protein